MKVYVYVEGQSDVRALNVLWQAWRKDLQAQGHGIKINDLENKSKYFRKIGPRAAEKLIASESDLVIGLPDLYPNREYENTEYEHHDLKELIQVQRTLVKGALEQVFNVRPDKADGYLERFYPCALKHDLEMLLLAAVDRMRTKLNTSERLENNFRRPVEDQNQTDPPKYSGS